MWVDSAIVPGGIADGDVSGGVPAAGDCLDGTGNEEWQDRRASWRDRVVGALGEAFASLGPAVGAEVAGQQTAVVGAAGRRTPAGPRGRTSGHNSGRSQ